MDQRLFEEGPEVTNKLPIEEEGEALFRAVDDWIILCKLINTSVNGTVNERTINSGKQNKFIIYYYYYWYYQPQARKKGRKTHYHNYGRWQQKHEQSNKSPIGKFNCNYYRFTEQWTERKTDVCVWKTKIEVITSSRLAALTFMEGPCMNKPN